MARGFPFYTQTMEVSWVVIMCELIACFDSGTCVVVRVIFIIPL